MFELPLFYKFVISPSCLNVISPPPDVRDLFPVMRDPTVFADLVALLTEHIQENYRDVDVIVGLDARGFIYAPLVAQKMGIKFSPIRKAGKLPGETVRASYSLEYGKVLGLCYQMDMTVLCYFYRDIACILLAFMVLN